MKDNVQEEKIFSWYEIEGSPSEVSAILLRMLPDNAIDPKFEVSSGWYDEDSQGKLTWWRPMTEKELEKASNKRKADRAANKYAKEKKEAEEFAEYERLKEKFEKGGK